MPKICSVCGESLTFSIRHQFCFGSIALSVDKLTLVDDNKEVKSERGGNKMNLLKPFSECDVQEKIAILFECLVVSHKAHNGAQVKFNRARSVNGRAKAHKAMIEASESICHYTEQLSAFDEKWHRYVDVRRLA